MNSKIKLHFIPLIYSAERNENRSNHFSECCKRWIWGEIFYTVYPWKRCKTLEYLKISWMFGLINLF